MRCSAFIRSGSCPSTGRTIVRAAVLGGVLQPSARGVRVAGGSARGDALGGVRSRRRSRRTSSTEEPREPRRPRGPARWDSCSLLFVGTEAFAIAYGLVMQAAGLTQPARLSSDLSEVFGSGGVGLGALHRARRAGRSVRRGACVSRRCDAGARRAVGDVAGHRRVRCDLRRLPLQPVALRPDARPGNRAWLAGMDETFTDGRRSCCTCSTTRLPSRPASSSPADGQARVFHARIVGRQSRLRIDSDRWARSGIMVPVRPAHSRAASAPTTRPAQHERTQACPSRSTTFDTSPCSHASH